MAGHDPQKKFVCRLVYAKCSYGSMSHPLNTAADGGHGVVCGTQHEPVLNANDHTQEHVLHFGDCTPREHDVQTGEAVQKKGFEKAAAQIKEFFTAQKCSPVLDEVWYEAKENFLIDGAPVLMMKSRLFCKRGGIITIEAEQTQGNG